MIEVLVGIVGLAAVVSAGYQSMAPTGQWYGRTFTGLPPGSRKLAFTYDDGPNDPHTLRLLEVLAKHNVKATFFLVGQYAKKRPDVAGEIAKAGHAIGNHTFSHRNLIFLSAQQTRLEIELCQQVLADAVGQLPVLFRPPFGGRRPGTLQVARSMQLQPIMWNVTGYDWRGKAADYVVQKVRPQVRGGNVILLHDGSHASFGADRAQTVITTDGLIRRFRDEGYEFATVPEMLGNFSC